MKKNKPPKKPVALTPEERATLSKILAKARAFKAFKKSSSSTTSPKPSGSGAGKGKAKPLNRSKAPSRSRSSKSAGN